MRSILSRPVVGNELLSPKTANGLMPRQVRNRTRSLVPGSRYTARSGAFVLECGFQPCQDLYWLQHADSVDISVPLVIVFAFGALFVVASRAPYYPLKYPGGFWELQSELGAKDVWLRASDRVRLHAWWILASQSALVTLYLHGNAGNVTHRSLQIREITAAGSSVLMLDYRGYGKSAGSPSEHGLYADADRAYQHLLDYGYSPHQIVLEGESLGTAVAVDLASRRECGGVVLEGAFTSGSDMANTVLPLIGPLVFRGFNAKRKIAGIRAPLLFFHGDRDEIVPFKLGRTLFEAAPEPKFFVEVPGAGHNDLVEKAGSSYRQRLQDFYRRLQS